jgi:ABC-type multidrug transport system ATPase subunit
MANDLEQRVLGGNVSFESDGGRAPRMEYRSPGRNPMGVHAASSLVKSLGAVDIYLRNFAQENDLVIIDEPEMNAHPNAQLAIAEFLAILVNRGIGVVVTTHSPYIVDHLKNLMEIAASKLTVRDTFASRLKLGSPKAFISADKVSIYLFNSDGTVAPILNREERSIDWSTFSNTSEEVTNLYADILEANRTE